MPQIIQFLSAVKRYQIMPIQKRYLRAGTEDALSNFFQYSYDVPSL